MNQPIEEAKPGEIVAWRDLGPGEVHDYKLGDRNHCGLWQRPVKVPEAQDPNHWCDMHTIAAHERDDWRKRALKAEEAQRHMNLCRSLTGCPDDEVLYEHLQTWRQPQGWIPIEPDKGGRSPTAADADEHGHILYRRQDGAIWVDHWEWPSSVAIAFLPLPKFTQPDPDKEAFEEAMDNHKADFFMCTKNRPFALELWQAALAYARKEEK
jgi:hypothetical protein